MHLILTGPVHQWEGANDALKPHGRLFSVELAWQALVASTSTPHQVASLVLFLKWKPKLPLVMVSMVDIVSSSGQLI